MKAQNFFSRVKCAAVDVASTVYSDIYATVDAFNEKVGIATAAVVETAQAATETVKETVQEAAAAAPVVVKTAVQKCKEFWARLMNIKFVRDAVDLGKFGAKVWGAMAAGVVVALCVLLASGALFLIVPWYVFALWALVYIATCAVEGFIAGIVISITFNTVRYIVKLAKIFFRTVFDFSPAPVMA